jgi:hypothetical protein
VCFPKKYSIGNGKEIITEKHQKNGKKNSSAPADVAVQQGVGVHAKQRRALHSS